MSKVTVMGHGDYPLQEFAKRLAEVEYRFAKELQTVIECFVQSRVDLPVKHLEDIGKCHSRRAKNLKKAVDAKKTDGVNLWKITNIYSASCVDEDDAMREVRASLRKHIKKEGMKVKMNGEDVNNSYRRVVADDYRPLVSQAPVVNAKITVSSSLTPPRDPSPPMMTEIYDVNGLATNEEKQRWLEMWKAQVEKEDKEREEVRRRLEKRQSMKIFGSTINIGSMDNFKSNISKFFGEKKSNQPSEVNNGAVSSPNPQRHVTDASKGPHHDPSGSGAWAAPRPVGDDELVMKF